MIAGVLAHTSYVAQARLLVLYGSDYVFHPGNRDTGSDITLDRNQIIQGELQILQSPALRRRNVCRRSGRTSSIPGCGNDESGLAHGHHALRQRLQRHQRAAIQRASR